MESRLKGKRVLVTGGASGIGRAIALALADAEAMIGIHYYRSVGPAAELKAALTARGLGIETFAADLCDFSQAVGLVGQFAAWAGGMDVLVNNAGDMVERRALETIDPDFLRRVMVLNFDSAVAVTRAALPHLKAAGRAGGAAIVNMSSLAGRLAGGTGAGAYCAAKGAILAWTRNLAKELGPAGVRVNAVAPGLILETAFHATHTPKDQVETIIRSIPLGRAGRPEDVARAVVYLAGEYDGFVSGAVIDINGGVYGA